MSDKEHECLHSSLVCIYAQLLPRIRERGKKVGYAIAVHGSMTRDLDLIAIPWVDWAVSAEVLVHVLAEEVGGFVIGAGKEVQSGQIVPEPTPQPHGRKSWNICWGGRPFLDLSVMPRL